MDERHEREEIDRKLLQFFRTYRYSCMWSAFCLTVIATLYVLDKLGVV